MEATASEILAYMQQKHREMYEEVDRYRDAYTDWLFAVDCRPMPDPPEWVKIAMEME